MEEKPKNGSLRIILSVSSCFILYHFFKVWIIHSSIKPGMRKSHQPKIFKLAYRGVCIPTKGFIPSNIIGGTMSLSSAFRKQ